MMKPVNTLSYIFFCMCLLIGACKNPVEQPQPTGFTFADEKDLGNELHKAMVGSTMFDVLDASGTYATAYQYLSGLRVKILATDIMERRQDFDWEFHIIKNDGVQDCFTTVGGKIYVTTGLLRDLVANEAQLLGVLAHEMYYADESYQMDIIQNNYTFTEILNVVYGGEDATALEMISWFYNTPRNANLVPQADQYGATILCGIGQISIKEFGQIIENAALTTPTSRWYINHPSPSTSSVNDRKQEMVTQQATCTTSSVNVYQQRYLDFLNNLPPR